MTKHSDDISDKMEYEILLPDCVMVHKCICGYRPDPCDFIICSDSKTPFVCPACKRPFYCDIKVRIYEVTDD